MHFFSDSVRVIVLIALRPKVPDSIEERIRRSSEDERQLDRTFNTHFSDAPDYLTGSSVPFEFKFRPGIMERDGGGVRARVFTSREKKVLVVEGTMMLRDRGQARPDGGEGGWDMMMEDVENLFNAVGDAALEDSGLKDDFDKMWVNRTLIVESGEGIGQWVIGCRDVKVGIDGLENLRIQVGWGNNAIVVPSEGDRSIGFDNALRRAEEQVVKGLTTAQFAWLDLEAVSAEQAEIVRRLQAPDLRRADLERIERTIGTLSLLSIGYQTNLHRLHEWSQGLWGQVARDLLTQWDVNKTSDGIDRRFDEIGRVLAWRRDVLDSRTKAQLEVVAFILATLSVIDLSITVHEFAASDHLTVISVGGRSVSLLELIAMVPADLWVAGAILLVTGMLVMYLRSMRSSS